MTITTTCPETPGASAAPNAPRRGTGGSRGSRLRHPAAVWRELLGDEQGLTTIEYAMCTLAAAALAAVLYGVVTSDQMTGALQEIIDKALNSAPL